MVGAILKRTDHRRRRWRCVGDLDHIDSSVDGERGCSYHHTCCKSDLITILVGFAVLCDDRVGSLLIVVADLEDRGAKLRDVGWSVQRDEVIGKIAKGKQVGWKLSVLSEDSSASGTIQIPVSECIQYVCRIFQVIGSKTTQSDRKKVVRLVVRRVVELTQDSLLRVKGFGA
jgi:hypothetical protein